MAVAIPSDRTAAVTFTAGVVSATASTVTASPATVAADGLATSTITVTLRDGSGNPVRSDGGGDVHGRGRLSDRVDRDGEPSHGGGRWAGHLDDHGDLARWQWQSRQIGRRR